MSYLTFEKSKLINLEQSLYREILRTNRAGSYSSSSIIGCNTRKYHGLLVCPLPNFDMMRHVLLSSLDVTIIQHNKEFNLGIHKYSGNHYEPKGHKYIRELEFDIIPRKVYRIGGVLFSVEEVLVEKQERILIKYTLLEANSPTKLKLKPFLANRSVHELTHENLEVNTKYSLIDNGISLQTYPSVPKLYMQLSKENEFVANPDWYRGIEYFKEQNRGYHYKEDLYVPGYFEVDINKGESIIFSASITKHIPENFKIRFDKEVDKRIPRDSAFNNLLNAAQQFFVLSSKGITMVAGYHWYGERLRDTLISVPQLTEALGDEDLFESVIDTSAKKITKIIKDKTILNIEEADTPLWFFWTIMQCWGELCIDNLWIKYYDFLKLVIKSYLSGRFENVKIDDNGLVVINDETIPLTWMNGMVDFKPVTPRNGACVEINALWYNALSLFFELAKQQKKDAALLKEIKSVLSKLEVSFIETFWNEDEHCLYDLVNGDFKDSSIRPNQVFATSFEYSPLSNEQKKGVVDILKEELLTPKGLRTLSPRNPHYVGSMEGLAHKRELGLHQGAVWPWLISFYAEGYLKLHKQSGISHIKRIAENFSEEMTEHCIGTLSEYYNGNPPQRGKGAVSMAWNVAGVLKILKLIEKYS